MKYPHFCGGEPTGSGLTYFFWCVFLEPHSFTILAQLSNRKWPVVDIALKSQEEPNQLWHPTQSMCGQTSWLPQSWPCFFSGPVRPLWEPRQTTSTNSWRTQWKNSQTDAFLWAKAFTWAYVSLMFCWSLGPGSHEGIFRYAVLFYKKHLNKDSKSYLCYKYQPWCKDCPPKQYPPSPFNRFGICPSFDYPGLECFS